MSRGELLRCRVRYFSDGVVLGSREFVESVFTVHRDQFGVKRKTGARRDAVWRVGWAVYDAGPAGNGDCGAGVSGRGLGRILFHPSSDTGGTPVPRWQTQAAFLVQVEEGLC